MSSKPATSKRQYKPKTKTGCRTCKIRRIKCDEEHPWCRRCTSTGRKCDGYEFLPPKGNIRWTMPLLAKPDRTCSLSHHRLASIPHLSSEESLGFAFFRSRTTSEIAGFFKSELWEYTVLQISHDEPCIKTSLSTLGFMHLSLQRGIEKTGSNQEGILGLQYYSKAIHLVRDRINNANSSESIQVALVCCLLFVCVEMLLCQNINALTHIQTGCRILLDLPESQKNDPKSLVPRYKGNFLIKQLEDIFSRLACDATYYGAQSPAMVLHSWDFPTSFPDIFRTVEEARRYLDPIMGSVSAFRGDLRRAASQNVPENISDWAMRDCWEHALLRKFAVDGQNRILRLQSAIRSSLDRWLAAFENFKRREKVGLASEDLRARNLLESQYFVGLFFMLTWNSTHEMDCDRFIPQFARVIQLVEEYVGIASSHKQAANLLPIFTVESGIFPSLTMVALKCRDSRIRRRAISLLSQHIRQEGLWVGKLIARYAKQVADLEEAQATPTNSNICAKDIPENARFADVTFAGTDNRTLGRLVCARFPSERDGDLEIVEHLFPLNLGQPFVA